MSESREREIRECVTRYFDRTAGRFPIVGDERRGFLAGLIDRTFRRSLRLRFAHTLRVCHPIHGGTVLDVGCGVGTYTTTMAVAGAARIVGIDPSRQMIEIARRRAAESMVSDKCDFQITDLAGFESSEPFDFSLALGVLDYVPDPERFVGKLLALTRRRAILSFPKSGGVLAWQRKLRYRWRCPLYLYGREDVDRLLASRSGWCVEIQSLARDWVATITRRAEGDV